MPFANPNPVASKRGNYAATKPLMILLVGRMTKRRERLWPTFYDSPEPASIRRGNAGKTEP